MPQRATEAWRGRANGNLHLHRFLAIADGVVRAQGRKILFTTNLPNVGDIDEALLRPGRCFANVRTWTSPTLPGFQLLMACRARLHPYIRTFAEASAAVPDGI